MTRGHLRIGEVGTIAQGFYIPSGPNFPRGGWWYTVRYLTPSGRRHFRLMRHEDEIVSADPEAMPF